MEVGQIIAMSLLGVVTYLAVAIGVVCMWGEYRHRYIKPRERFLVTMLWPVALLLLLADAVDYMVRSVYNNTAPDNTLRLTEGVGEWIDGDKKREEVIKLEELKASPALVGTVTWPKGITSTTTGMSISPGKVWSTVSPTPFTTTTSTAAIDDYANRNIVNCGLCNQECIFDDSMEEEDRIDNLLNEGWKMTVGDHLLCKSCYSSIAEIS